MITVTSTHEADGKKHMGPWANQPDWTCLGEVVVDGVVGALVQFSTPGLVQVSGESITILPQREALSAFSAAANQYHAEIMASIGGNSTPHHPDCNDCDWSRCDCANCEWGGAK